MGYFPEQGNLGGKREETGSMRKQNWAGLMPMSNWLDCFCDFA